MLLLPLHGDTNVRGKGKPQGAPWDRVDLLGKVVLLYMLFLSAGYALLVLVEAVMGRAGSWS